MKLFCRSCDGDSSDGEGGEERVVMVYVTVVMVMVIVVMVTVVMVMVIVVMVTVW